MNFNFNKDNQQNETRFSKSPVHINKEVKVLKETTNQNNEKIHGVSRNFLKFSLLN